MNRKIDLMQRRLKQTPTPTKREEASCVSGDTLAVAQVANTAGLRRKEKERRRKVSYSIAYRFELS